MLNDTLGWICGRNQTLLKTTDAGLNWESVITGYNYDYWSFDFLDQNYWMIACSQGKVLKTIDGGLSWTEYQAGNIEDLYTIDIIDSLHIAAAGYLGKTVYSSDGGISWVENQQYSANPVNWIQFINRDTGYIALESSVSLHKTTNRGESWAEAGFSHTGEWQFELLQDNIGYGVGSGLKITKTEDQFNTGYNLFLNVNWSDVYFINDQKGFGISWSGLSSPSGLYGTTDGGINWERLSGAPDGTEIIFIDSLTGFIGGDSIYKTTDGGGNWYVPNGGSGSAGKIFFIDDLIGWAIGSNVIYKSTDRGENWFTKFTGPDNFTSIFFVDSLNGWATSRYIWQTTNGGTDWMQRIDIPITFSDDVYFPNLDTGWIGRYSSINNSLFKTTDGGLNWIALSEVVGARKFFFFPDPVHWLTIGFSRYYITNDYGNNWIEFTEDVPAGLVSFHSPINEVGYAVGNLGLILQYDDTTYTPVELTSFNGEATNKNVVLTWSTSTETNNSGFEIERLQNYKTTKLQDWEKIGFVNGNGTTTEEQSYSFLDRNISSGVYKYRLKQIDFDGKSKYSKEIEVDVPAPALFSLEQNYPNPFNPETKISFTIPEETNVSIKLYDITGREIRVLVNEKKRPGYYTIKLKGGELSSGVYFYRLVTTSGYTAVKKLILLK